MKEALQLKLEDVKLNWIKNEIDRVGIPTATRNEQTISHLAYQFSYNEQHEQANWVMHVIINLDQKFPHQVFSISIFESSINNFDYKLEIYLLNQEVCFTGVITEYNDTSNMVINHGKQIELLNEMM